MRAANPNELKCRLATSGNFIANVTFIIEIIIHCHTRNFDTKKENIVLISETL